jgi:hypothetical protein
MIHDFFSVFFFSDFFDFLYQYLDLKIPFWITPFKRGQTSENQLQGFYL